MGWGGVGGQPAASVACCQALAALGLLLHRAQGQDAQAAGAAPYVRQLLLVGPHIGRIAALLVDLRQEGGGAGCWFAAF